ncbi:MAG: beta-lactamase family protein [Chitinophagaceae bacterium]|nr:beta-lactamase family protein [Chitinophagaceae bacterium]
MNKLLLCILLVALTESVHSQQKSITKADGKKISAKQIDQTINRLMNAAAVSGLQIGIINNNQTALVKSYGYKNKTRWQVNNPATSFYAASFSKSLFAFIAMQLVDQKKLELDKPLYQYLRKPLPEYVDYKDLEGDDRWKLITARHCLSHTTGFPNWRNLNPKGVQKLEFFFDPGSKYAYSGEGIVLLQLAIEAITGEKLETLAQKQVFVPFEMTRTSFTWQPAFNDDYANGHSVDEDTLAIRKRNNANAAGSMQTTITDYTNFLAAMLQGKGLSNDARKEMLKPQISIFSKRQFPSLNTDTTTAYRAINLSYGLGWGIFNTSYGQAFFKEGHSDDGWEHYSIAIPDTKFALVLMSNSMNAESIYKELVEILAGISIPWDWEGYIPYKPMISLTRSMGEMYPGEYMGEFDARIFLEKGQLKAESKGAGLKPRNIYPTTETSFFMKNSPITIEFIKKNGIVGKIKVFDGEKAHELIRVETDTPKVSEPD